MLFRSFAARFLAERGAVIVAVSDSSGAVENPDGLDLAALEALKASGQPVSAHAGGRTLHRDALIGVDCDIWVPAARPDAINEDNLDQLKARLVIPGANIAVTDAAERELHRRGVICLPDFIANAGGVICAAVEYHGGSEAAAFEKIETEICRNTRAVLESVAASGCTPRDAAVDLATQRVRNAMAMRRWSTF